MKLLTWMHRKLRQNNTNEMLPPGQAMFNTQHLHSKPTGAAFAQPPKESRHLIRKSFTGMESVELDRELPEPFHGFLAIGTLGGTETTTFMSEPETPTFSISVDNIAERETQYVTEGELKLINDELEKVLGAETKEEDSSARNSSAAVQVVSSGKTAMEMTESSGNNVCPLQGYLFGSTVELAAAQRLMVEKKENRTSLGELFQRQKAADEGRSEPAGGEKRSAGKETAINHLMKKILKRKMVDASTPSHRNNNSSAATASASAETKLHKVLHMFQKKVHPETSTCMPRLNTQYGCRIKHGDPLCHYDRSCISYGDRNKELWIKSDADYLVLEL